MHLLIPLLSSILLVVGLILIKRASVAGVPPVTTLFLTNISSAIVLSSLWFWGGRDQPWSLLWQPALVALLFMLGLALTFLAIERGDVSVAAPVFGVKVFIVAVLLTVFGQQQLPLAVWSAAVLATLGIALIQWTGRGQPKRIGLTILLSFSAATSFASFDVLVQAWAPAWGAARFLSISYTLVGLLSLVMLPWVWWPATAARQLRRYALPGALLIAVQSTCIVLTIAIFGDAARVNVVYALRGLWGVTLAWAAARIWGGGEAEIHRSMMLTRLVGATLLTAGVGFAILAC
jgi:drug/metabolite transporter (DMT)-like permease